MRKIIPYIVLLAMIVSIVVPVGIGYTYQPPTLKVVLGELNYWGDWSINPCKYEGNGTGWCVAKTTVTNLSDKETRFDMGDGKVITLLGNSSMEHSYQVLLTGQTEIIWITKLTDGMGINTQHAQGLKIVPVEDN